MIHPEEKPNQHLDAIRLSQPQSRDHFTVESLADPSVLGVPEAPSLSGRSASRDQDPAWHLRCRSRRNNKKTKLWREVCRPGDGSPGRLLGLSLVIGVFVWSILLVERPDPDVTVPPKSRPVTIDVAPNPRSAAVLLGRIAPPNLADEGGLVSEAEEDSIAAMAAAAWQLDTDFRLSQLDMQRVWNLNNHWRPLLDEFQDALIGLASLATLGGSWVGHEICRNELALESELIAPHALALSAGEPDADPTTGASQLQREARAEQWEALWQRIRESTDAQVRSSDDLEDFWKSQLDEFLENAHRVHQALLPQICDLADEAAAQAVVRYYEQYFSANFPTTAPDSAEQ